MLEALLNFFDCLGEDLADLRVQRDRRLDAGGIEDICKTPQPNAFKAENVLLGIRHEKEGKLRVTYAGQTTPRSCLTAMCSAVTGRSIPLPPEQPPPSKNRRGCAPNYGTTLCPKNVRNRPRFSKPRA